jgi:hypothetical protein
MNKEKEIKIGSLVKMHKTRRPERVWPVSGLYGIVCETQPATSLHRPHPRPMHHIHLQNGDKYWAWKSEFKVIA